MARLYRTRSIVAVTRSVSEESKQQTLTQAENEQ
jgi:hypothetical protein